MFQKSTDTFQSSNGFTPVSCYFYEPAEREPAAVVQISHGMCEYVERYEDFAAYLCSQGFAVCGNDHLGHGRTARTPDDLGYFGDKAGAAILVEDLCQMTGIAQQRYPGLPVFLFGHSMGSFVARLYLSKYAALLRGAILCGTTGGNVMAGAGCFLASRIAAAKGAKYRSPLLTKLAFGSYNKRFSTPKSPNAWLSRDASVVAKYDADPWCTFTFTASAYRELFAMVKRISAPEWAASVPRELPVLLIAGEEDPVGNYGAGVRKTAAKLLEAELRDVSCRIYEGGRHEVLNELNRSQVYADVCRWLKGRI